MTVVEILTEATRTFGRQSSADRLWFAYDTNSETEAMREVMAIAPTMIDLLGDGQFYLPRKQVSLAQVLSDTQYFFRVSYGSPNPSGESTDFEIGGQTAHITHSIKTVKRYGRAALHQRAINVGSDGQIGGVDIVVPSYTEAITREYDDTDITPAFKKQLFALAGCVNSKPFRIYNAGECLFVGASGARRGTGPWSVTYRFAGSPNLRVDVQNVDGEPPDNLIPKNGWDYLWIETEDYIDDDGTVKRLAKRPVAAHLEQVYRYADLTQLGI